jgi:DNA-binding XRE family transcriptional regulator
VLSVTDERETMNESVPANNLKEARQHEGLKVTQLQGHAGVSTAAIRNTENGTYNHTVELKHRMVNGLNANPRHTKVWTFEEIFPNG